MDPVIVRRAARGDEPCPVRPLDELVDAARDSPHNSGSGGGTMGRVAEIFLDNLARFESGVELRNEVTG